MTRVDSLVLGSDPPPRVVFHPHKLFQINATKVINAEHTKTPINVVGFALAWSDICIYLEEFQLQPPCHGATS